MGTGYDVGMGRIGAAREKQMARVDSTTLTTTHTKRIRRFVANEMESGNGSRR